MRWYLKQIETASNGAVRFTSGFEYKYLSVKPVFADVLMTEKQREEIWIRAEGPWVKLVFHVHAWCGASSIQVNGEERREDFYSNEHGFRELAFESKGGAPIELRIRTGADPNPKAKANQLWLASIEFASVQSWTALSQPVTETCTLTRGTYGTFLTLSNDVTIGASISSTGVWAPKDVALFKALVSEGMTALDVGANVGHHTVVYGRLVGETGRVVSFEPQSAIFRILSANTVLNGGFNTDLVQACVGDAEGFLNLYPVDYRSQTNFGALGVDPKPDARAVRGEKCRVARLDDLLAELNRPLERVDFVKVDVQSFELYVLRGATATIERHKPTFFLEISPYWMGKSYDYKEVYQFLWDAGYVVDHLSDASVEPSKVKEWSGRETEEWDILARHKDGVHAGLDIQRLRELFN